MAGEPAELRLLVPAGLAWLSATTALSMSAGVGLVAAAILLALGLMTARAVRSARRERVRVRGRVVTAALLCAAGAAAATAWRVGAVHRGPLPQLARAHASVTLVLVVTSDPHLAASSSGPTRSRSLVVLTARAVDVSTAQGSARISSPIVVLATSPGWISLQPTQRVTAAGRVSVPQPGELATAVFDPRGSPTDIGAPSLVQRFAGHLRTGLRAAASPLPRAPGGLLPGLVDGDTSGLPSDVVKDFRTTGLTHIVAVSGAIAASVIVVRR